MSINDNNSVPSVMDMVKEFAAEQGTPEEDLFKRSTPPAKSEPEPETTSEEETVPNSLTMTGNITDDDLTLPIYDASEITSDNAKAPLVNMVDDQVKAASEGQFEEMQRVHVAIEASKARLGIKHMNVPPFYHHKVINCASDPSPAAAEKLDNLLMELIDMFPDMIVERVSENPSEPETIDPPADETHDPDVADGEEDDKSEESHVTVIIDKRQANEVAFSSEDLEKIRNARSVEVKIVEDLDLKYNIIDEPANDIEQVLSQFTRKFNDRIVSLPASRYRCTLTGLSYPEALDLDYSLQVDTLDAEIRKWSIAYSHIKNPSIGAFADFNDFLQKTSHRDIDYILWGILCATSMSKEIVAVDCKHNDCNTTHEWIYSPESLLQMDKIPEFVLEDMRITGEASGRDEIMSHYNGSMLRLNQVVELPSSGFVVGFGHISAYSYLNDGIFANIREATKADPPLLSALLEAEIMGSVKYILLPSNDGKGHYRITDQDRLRRIIHELDEMDYQVIGQIGSMMSEPYSLEFKIKDIVCPKCHNRSDAAIPNILNLLFIIAQGLESAKVVLKK